MSKENEVNTNKEPKVYVEKQPNHVNQPFFYRNSKMDNIHARFSEVQRTIGTHGQVHRTFSNQLNEQQGFTQKLERMHDELKETVQEKSDIQQELLMKVKRYEKENNDFKKQFEELIQSKHMLEEQVIHLEKAKKDLYGEISQHHTYIQEQVLQFQKVESEQLDQKVRHDELVQQVALQEIDHEDLLKKVKENKEEYKLTQLQVEDLLKKTAALVLQHREQEKMHLELYTQLIQLKAVSTEVTKHLNQSLAKLNSEVKQIQTQNKSAFDSVKSV
ncbi:hypothetical protein [Alkalihalobacillus deserti]|uniref:hypothetical protein n=1 Tax=Alkalihalobacillus deserti TaxID=2879466 RepID=UPI001D148662|nr:hypothetical protein [Alkalihalobacillus deserti]